MKISQARLEKEAVNTGFRPEILEKVIHLMELLNDFALDPYLSSRIALKGGTALNLFCYDCPRLSVDIDINYIGSADRSIMLDERETLITKIEEICKDKDYRSQ
jgi:predicted nucleotidyltransferase component of viral defense system